MGLVCSMWLVVSGSGFQGALMRIRPIFVRRYSTSLTGALISRMVSTAAMSWRRPGSRWVVGAGRISRFHGIRSG